MLTGCPLCRDINWMSPVQGHPVNCDGETQVTVGEMFDELEWPYLLRPRGTSPPCFSFTRFIVEQCLLKKTSI